MREEDEFDFDDDNEYEYEDDYSERGRSGGAPIIYMTLGLSLFILILLGAIIASNNKNNKGSGNYAKYVASKQNEQETEEESVSVNNSKRTADDLDIWDMYKNKKDDSSQSANADNNESENNSKPLPSPVVSPLPTMSPGAEDDEKYNDGKHFKIELKDGSSEWVTIDTTRERNNYDFTKFISNDGKLKYYNDGRATSFLGIDVSRYQKDIDFNQVKNSGIDFVMIRVGARGYQTGQVALDEYFTQNITRAKEAGLDVGVYFYSQAVNEAEALEEANLLIEACKDYKLTYPVAFDMELVDNDISRVQSLSKDDRTVITGTFLNRITEAGYKPMIYGDEEWLVKRVDLKKLPVAGVWLADESEMPDYPYQFSLWQYSTNGNVFGVNGPVNMDVCFIDYSAQ